MLEKKYVSTRRKRTELVWLRVTHKTKTLSTVYVSATVDKISFSHLASLWDIAGKWKREKKSQKGSAQKVVLPRSMLMHVLHHICANVLEEEWRVKLLWIRYLISAGVYIFHPIPPSPRLSSLWFLSFFCLLKELTVLLSVSALSECLCCALFPPFFHCDEKSLKKQCLGVEWHPSVLCFISSLSVLTSADDEWYSLQVSCRCGPFGTFWGSIFYAHKHTHWDVSVCTDMPVLKYSHKGSNTCTRRSSQCVNKVGDHLPNVFIFFVKPWKHPC